MAINFDVVIDTDDDSVDMKSGLDTLQGVSDATRYIAETILCERVPERQSHKAKVRTMLKQSFKGSYGQKFSVEVFDERLQSRLRRIGNATFVELVAYYLNDAMYKDVRELSAKAKSVVDGLGECSDELAEQLRVSSLRNIHDVTLKFNHDVKIRYRKNREEQIVLAKFDQDTAGILEVVHSNEVVTIDAAVTRFNTRTGNGRLQLKGEDETVAFGFDREYRSLEISAKRIFSENLHFNNGKPIDHCAFLNLQTSTLRLHNGKIVKYVIKGYGV